MDAAQEAPQRAEPPPENKDPIAVSSMYHLVIGILVAYGWYIIIGVILLFIAKSKLDPHIQKWRKKREVQEAYDFDAATALKRQEAMDAARHRLQDQYDSQTQQFAEEQRKKDEQKRQEKIADWEGHCQGKGYRSKLQKPKKVEPTASTSPPKPKPKASGFRPDYNPMMGGGGTGYRPARRGGGG